MLIYSFCRYSLCLYQGFIGVFTGQRPFFSKSQSNLLVRLVMGTNTKMTKRIKCIDFDRADRGVRHTHKICGSQIKTITTSRESMGNKWFHLVLFCRSEGSESTGIFVETVMFEDYRRGSAGGGGIVQA